MEESIGIKFDLKSPQNYRESVLNSIVLLVDNIRRIEEQRQFDNIDIQILNDNIEKTKNELDSLKIIKFEEEI